MPTISPSRLTSGPPELPGKMTASWPIQRISSPTLSPSIRKAPPGGMSARFETIPCVTDCERPAGLPIASTTSPIWRSSESPNAANGSGARPSRRAAGSILRIVRSESASVPMSSAGSSSRLVSRTVIRLPRPATWWLVMMCPSALMIAPEPVPRDFCIRPELPASITTSMRTSVG